MSIHPWTHTILRVEVEVEVVCFTVVVGSAAGFHICADNETPSKQVRVTSIGEGGGDAATAVLPLVTVVVDDNNMVLCRPIETKLYDFVAAATMMDDDRLNCRDNFISSYVFDGALSLYERLVCAVGCWQLAMKSNRCVPRTSD